MTSPSTSPVTDADRPPLSAGARPKAAKRRRALQWVVASLAVLLVAGFVARAVDARRSEQAVSARAAATRPVLELAPADVVTARPTELTRTLPVSGGLRAVDTAVVKARVAAEVKALSVREGDPVKAGQVIGQLDTTEYEFRLRQAEQTAASAKAQLDIASRELNNSRALVAQGFISANGLETSASNEAAARATYQAAAAAAALAAKSRRDAALVAPIDGVVSQRLVQPGERVSLDARLVEIVDLRRIELEAAIAAEDIGEVRVGQMARLKVDGLAAPVTATVARINPSTQAGTRAVTAYLALEPQPGLRQGLFATGQIDLQRQTALVLPLSAVRVDQALPYVLAVDEGKVVQRTVALGARGSAVWDGRPDAAIEITAGIAAGAVVLRGTAGAVRDGTPVRLAAGVTASAPP